MLTLPIKKKWFDMIRSGEKREEYRDIKPYWTTRFINAKLLSCNGQPTGWVAPVTFKNGYAKDAPTVRVLCGLHIGYGKKEWGAERDKECYVLEIIRQC